MDNKEYVLEKLAMSINYAGNMGRFLAKMGNKDAQKVIAQFKESYGKALDMGYTRSLGGFIKDMDRNPVVARDFIKSQEEAAQVAEAAKNVVRKEGDAPAGKQWSIFKPWSRKAKIIAASGVAVGTGAGAGLYMHNKGQMQPTEEELYQMQGQ